MKNLAFISIQSLVLTILVSFIVQAQSSNILWYNQPAQYFEESLVLGNGKNGASVFGGVNSEKIFLNDATLWSGEPVNANMNPDAYKFIPEIREALKNENYKLADSLNRKVQGKFSESFAPLGTMLIDFVHDGIPQNYYRELDISNAISKTKYNINDTEFTREYFISCPDQIMVIKLTSNVKGALNFNIKFNSQLQNIVSSSQNILKINGYAPIHAEPSYRGDRSDAIIFDENRGARFSALFEIKNTDGKVTSNDSTIGLHNGTEAIIYISIATSFNGFDKDPAKEGVDDKKIAFDQLKNAIQKSYEKLMQTHILDFQTYFNRVSLNLGETDAPNLPTNERLKRYVEGKEDKNLEILYFQYGRYLLISSSRTKGVPANLQGIWNPYIRPPWSSNYTLNINAEENYWLAENANLSEMHLPLLSFIKNISVTGKITAQTFYGVEGWTSCHNSDIWAMSNPVGNFGEGDPVWANWNMGGAWLSTHLWEHFLFTQDKEYLTNEAYELMKGVATFCLNWLIEKEGKLLTSPSTSPENKFVTPDGFHGATLYGGTADLAMIRECFINTIEASKVLNLDFEFRTKLENALSRLHPYKIGNKGNLQEWYYDWEDEDPYHRHQSHLFGLYPGHHINPNKTPELANACRRTLEIKGDESTGWSKAWRINLWARLWDGNHAYKMFRELLKYVEPDGMRTNYSGGGGTYPNLFDAHPPFQIDGNFGGSAAVIEMLMQSSENEIRLLPALPDAWESGSVKGICARGGFVISMEWENKNLTKLGIKSRNGGTTTIISGGTKKEITLSKGEEKFITW
ncbi:MAG: glycoside hydrolase family 95 protein [Melioribacteraceae bacterium]